MKRLHFTKCRTSLLAVLLAFSVAFVPVPFISDTSSDSAALITTAQAAQKNTKDRFSIKEVPKYSGKSSVAVGDRGRICRIKSGRCVSGNGRKNSKGTGKKQIKFAPQKWKRAFAGRPCFLFNLSSCSCILVVFEICKDFFFVRILFLLSCSSYNVNKCYNIYDQCKETDNRHHGRICICASAGSDSV